MTLIVDETVRELGVSSAIYKVIKLVNIIEEGKIPNKRQQVNRFICFLLLILFKTSFVVVVSVGEAMFKAVPLLRRDRQMAAAPTGGVQREGMNFFSSPHRISAHATWRERARET